MIAGNLAADVIDLIQNKVIELHKAGRIIASEGVYIGTSTCARVAAVLIGGQLPTKDGANLTRIIESFNRMFDSETRTVFEHRLATESQTSTKAVKKEGSAWDA